MAAAEPDFDLTRFVEAQAGKYTLALAELTRGETRSHWMWFIFPQLKGLGQSPTARHFGIGSLDEARAYLAHPLLGPRLFETTRAVMLHRQRSLLQIFGQPDNMKFRSSMTLFAEAGDPADAVLFRQAIDLFCYGQADEATLKLLSD